MDFPPNPCRFSLHKLVDFPQSIDQPLRFILDGVDGRGLIDEFFNSLGVYVIIREGHESPCDFRARSGVSMQIFPKRKAYKFCSKWILYNYIKRINKT